MNRLFQPSQFIDNLIAWVLLVGLLITITVVRFRLYDDHVATTKQLTTLQTEITTLRAELKAHDEKPEWSERKE